MAITYKFSLLTSFTYALLYFFISVRRLCKRYWQLHKCPPRWANVKTWWWISIKLSPSLLTNERKIGYVLIYLRILQAAIYSWKKVKKEILKKRTERVTCFYVIFHFLNFLTESKENTSKSCHNVSFFVFSNIMCVKKLTL